MVRNLNLTPRVENTREPLTTVFVQFTLSEIKNRFDDSLNAIRDQFEVAEYLILTGKSKEAEKYFQEPNCISRHAPDQMFARNVTLNSWAKG